MRGEKTLVALTPYIYPQRLRKVSCCYTKKGGGGILKKEEKKTIVSASSFP